VPADKNGHLLPADDFMLQAEQVFNNISAVLASSGAELRHVVRLVTYLTRQEDVSELRQILDSTFGTEPPANSVVLVSGLTESSILLEIEATAVL
jgi:enamine deaminase RidA (YjgF/YER057c/UK114 family)